jgi:hypothetical protein
VVLVTSGISPLIMRHTRTCSHSDDALRMPLCQSATAASAWSSSVALVRLKQCSVQPAPATAAGPCPRSASADAGAGAGMGAGAGAAMGEWSVRTG